MPKRPLTLCRKAGCNELVEGGGYCAAHTRAPKEQSREAFTKLDAKKTPEQRAFYSSKQWTAASLRHRELEPLCRRCKAAGRIVAATLVHHNPPVEELKARGLSPHDDNYLESLCFRCHQKETFAGKRG